MYPLAISAIGAGTINLASATSGAFKMGLCVSSSATWGSTQQAFQFVSDVTGAYTEVTSAGYARVSLTTLSQARTTNKIVWTCASPIVFGTTITLTAATAFIYTTLVGSADASFPVIAIIDFGGSVPSTAGLWEYTVDATNGLAAWTES